MSKKTILLAARNRPVSPPPIWMMRQAGRFLPEYHETKEKAGGFLGLCKIPEYGVEVVMQPIRRFDLDAAILFSDILIPAEAMGLSLAFNPGPVFASPVRTASDVDALRIPDPEESMPFVLEMLRGLRTELPEDKALIGFAGTPFTVATYMIEGSSSAQFPTARALLYSRPDIVHRLLEKLVETTSRYLRAQVHAGAEILALFDSSAYCLSPSAYGEFALAYAQRIVQQLADTDTPIIYFAPGAMTQLGQMPKIGAHVIGLDWRIGLGEARTILGPNTPVQGNLDPAALLGTEEAVRRQTKWVLDQNRGRPGHIFNLGHGVLQHTPPQNVQAMVAAVREGV